MDFGVSLLSGDGRAPAGSPTATGLVLGQGEPSRKCYCPMMALRTAHRPSAASAIFQIALKGEFFPRSFCATSPFSTFTAVRGDGVEGFLSRTGC